MGDLKRWSGKIAVVTGASAGIGVAIVEKLVENGLEVVGIARRQERLDKLAENLKKIGKFIPYKADLSDKNEIIEAFKWIAKNVGPVSILVNNAGVSLRTTIVDGDIDAWRKVIDTNFFGLAVASREALSIMRQNKIDGHIVNINSIQGHEALFYPTINVYPASKFAVTGFTETLRKELAAENSKIRVTSISPGYVNTEIFDAGGYTEKDFSDMEQAPYLQPVDLAEAVLYVIGAPAHVQITELTIKPTGELV